MTNSDTPKLSFSLVGYPCQEFHPIVETQCGYSLLESRVSVNILHPSIITDIMSRLQNNLCIVDGLNWSAIFS